jgi:GNAT superfamily N-acetyltransferase
MPETIIRPARAGDETGIFALIEELAHFEKLEHQLTGNPSQLAVELFGERPHAEALVAERADRIVGYAIFFTTFSSFLARSGIWLEDLYVTESERGRGTGKALLESVATLAGDRGAGRFEWAVLDWNRRAIEFYEAVGAEVLPDWRVCRVEGDRLNHLASRRRRSP